MEGSNTKKKNCDKDIASDLCRAETGQPRLTSGIAQVNNTAFLDAITGSTIDCAKKNFFSQDHFKNQERCIGY